MTKPTKRNVLLLTMSVWGIVCLSLLYRDELNHWVRSLDRWRTEHAIKQCCTDLPAVDEIRLLHLEPVGATPSLGRYITPLEPREEMVIVAEKIISGSEAQEFTELWQRQLLHTGSFTACHEPHHVLQFRKDGKVITEVVVCFMCHNLAIPRFPGWDLVSIMTLPLQDFDHLRSVVEGHVGAHVSKGASIK